MRAKLNGTELFFDSVGSCLVPAGDRMVERPVCFMLHGGPLVDSSYLRPWMDSLSEIMQLVYVDYRGTGRSIRMSPESYTLENTIDDLDALRIYLGLGRIAILGHSHGGKLAMSYAIKFPDSVSHLILVATTPYTGPEYEAESESNLNILISERPDLAPMIQEYWYTEKPQTLEDIKAQFHRTFSIWFHRPDHKIVSDVAERIIYSPDVLNWWVEHEGPKYDVRDKLDSIGVPTIIMAGRHDWRTTVRHAEVMKRGIPGSELVVFEESGHQLYIEEPGKFRSAVMDFLERHPLTD